MLCSNNGSEVLVYREVKALGQKTTLRVLISVYVRQFIFFFQAEDGIRDAQESRGLGDVYKRQEQEDSKSESKRLPKMVGRHGRSDGKAG